MINFLQLTEYLKGLPQNAVMQMAAVAGDPMQRTLAVGEMQRRQRMAANAQAQMAKPTQSIAEQVMARGLGLAPMQQPAPQPTMPMQTTPATQPMGGGLGSMVGGSPPSQPTMAVGRPMQTGGPVSLEEYLRDPDAYPQVQEAWALRQTPIAPVNPQVRRAPRAPAVDEPAPVEGAPVEGQATAQSSGGRGGRSEYERMLLELIEQNMERSNRPDLGEQIERYNALRGDRPQQLENMMAKVAALTMPSGRRQGWETLAAIGGRIAEEGSRSPNFLTALSRGLAGTSDMLQSNRRERAQASQQALANQLLLAGMDERALAAGMGLYGAERGAADSVLSNVQSGLGSLLSAQTQRDVANIYASRPGGGSGSSSLAFRAAQSIFTRESIRLGQIERALDRAIENGSDETELADLRRRAEDQRRRVQEAREELARVSALEEQGLDTDFSTTQPSEIPDSQIGSGIGAMVGSLLARQAPRSPTVGSRSAGSRSARERWEYENPDPGSSYSVTRR